MACKNCGINSQNSSNATVSTVTINDIGNTENFLGYQGHHDHKPYPFPKDPIFRFAVTKNPVENIQEAMKAAYRKKPALKLGEPAVVQYYSTDKNGKQWINLLLCIGAGCEDNARMFFIPSITSEDFKDFIQNKISSGDLVVDYARESGVSNTSNTSIITKEIEWNEVIDSDDDEW